MADPSVRWLAAARALSLIAAPLSLYFLVTRQPLSERGFYLIAINAVAFAQLFETGMGTLVVQFAARVRPSERGVLRAVADAWFRRAAIVVGALGLTLGTWVIWRGAMPGQLSATGPWLIVLACTAAYVALVPLVCLREGLGGSEAVQRMRAIQATAIAVVVIVGLMRARGIDAAAAAAVTQLAVAGIFVWRGRRAIPGADSGGGRLVQQYHSEQARSAKVWIALWIAPQVLTPATMLMHGATEAGEIGLHVALALAPPVLATAWMHARYPRLGALVASGAIRTFDETAKKAFGQALAVFAAAAAAVVALAAFAPSVFPFLAGRVLSWSLVAVLLVGSLALVSFQAMLAWFRAFGDEKFAPQVVAACTAMAMGGIGGAALGGSMGAAGGYGVTAIAVTTIVGIGFARLRAQRLEHP
ncbi:MAG: hypothetical protein FJ202_01830 [Gemmatimonadetes bacterium]|nr:hypothetical protein [Gemmatimonadota bacterium]